MAGKNPSIYIYTHVSIRVCFPLKTHCVWVASLDYQRGVQGKPCAVGCFFFLAIQSTPHSTTLTKGPHPEENHMNSRVRFHPQMKTRHDFPVLFILIVQSIYPTALRLQWIWCMVQGYLRTRKIDQNLINCISYPFCANWILAILVDEF